MNSRKYERLGIWTAQFGGSIKSVECPGCLEKMIHLDKYKGWEACHIMAHARGNTREIYNMFALCAVCNKRMGTKNMFCYFWDTHNKHALEELIKYVKKVIKVHFPTISEQCRSQMYELAERLYKERRLQDGGIPEDHPVWKFFIEQDIKENNAKTIEAHKKYQEKLALAEEINTKYTKKYIPKRIELPTLSKRKRE